MRPGGALGQAKLLTKGSSPLVAVARPVGGSDVRWLVGAAQRERHEVVDGPRLWVRPFLRLEDALAAQMAAPAVALKDLPVGVSEGGRYDPLPRPHPTPMPVGAHPRAPPRFGADGRKGCPALIAGDGMLAHARHTLSSALPVCTNLAGIPAINPVSTACLELPPATNARCRSHLCERESRATRSPIEEPGLALLGTELAWSAPPQLGYGTATLLATSPLYHPFRIAESVIIGSAKA